MHIPCVYNYESGLPVLSLKPTEHLVQNNYIYIIVVCIKYMVEPDGQEAS